MHISEPQAPSWKPSVSSPPTSLGVADLTLHYPLSRTLLVASKELSLTFLFLNFSEKGEYDPGDPRHRKEAGQCEFPPNTREREGEGLGELT